MNARQAFREAEAVTSPVLGSSHHPSVGLVGGPVERPWREGTLTRAAELEALSAWMVGSNRTNGNGRRARTTGVLGDAIARHLLLMRGEFIPGLSALDSSAQIVSWAIVFGYAQQLFTQFVDRQGNTVLDSVRGGPASSTRPIPAADAG
jgi:hypothetical protein